MTPAATVLSRTEQQQRNRDLLLDAAAVVFERDGFHGARLEDVAAGAELLLLAVPDTELAAMVAGLAATGVVTPGTIVVHTSGANGIGVLAPLTDRGCLPLALHPVMTFTGADDDIDRLVGACFGITAADETP